MGRLCAVAFVIAVELILLQSCREAKPPNADQQLACFEVLRLPDYPISAVGAGQGDATARYRLELGKTVISVDATPALKAAILPGLEGSRLRPVCKDAVTLVYRFRNPGMKSPHTKWELRYPNILTVYAENYGPPGFVDYLRP